MDKNEGAFAFTNITCDLFSVSPDITDEVEDIVLNLESDSNLFTEFDESIYFSFTGAADDSSDTAWRDAGIPSSFLDTHRQVVIFIKIPSVIADPTQFDMLPFNNLVTELYKFR